MTRRTFLFTALAALVLAATPGLERPVSAQTMSSVEMWRSPGCSCCGKWAAHMERAGYEVTINDSASAILDAIKRKTGIGGELAACHTAKVGGYVVEGHVPAQDVKRLLAEKPEAIGLAVPGMPVGSPGMEVPSGETEAYDVLLVKKDGSTEVFASH